MSAVGRTWRSGVCGDAMASGSDNIHVSNSSDDFSLESILAEYKGSAFIDGDKKTPPEVLDAQAEKIIMEASGKIASGSVLSSESAKVPEKAEKSDDAVHMSVRQTAARHGAKEESKPETAPDETPAAEKNAENTEKDKDVLFFDNFRYSDPKPEELIMEEVQRAVEKEFAFEEETRETAKRAFSIFGRFRSAGQKEHEYESSPEPTLKDAAGRFARACGSISFRGAAVVPVTLMMVLLTFGYEAGLIIPFGIGRSQALSAGTLMLLLLVVMLVNADLIVRGAVSLVRGVPNAESLILFSCAFSLISGVFTVITGGSGILPYCAVSALSLTFAAFGEKYYLRAITETLKTAVITSEPYGVLAEYNDNIDKSVLKKAYNRTDGFYKNLMYPDITDTAYRFAAPVLLAAALVLSAFAALAKSQGEYFLHILSAMLAAAAPFSMMLAFSVPFSMVTRAARKSGAAMAGWGGADDICHTDGACVTDEDIFPPGTLSQNGWKVFNGMSPEKVIRYTASLVIASGSGLSRAFSEMLKEAGMGLIKVEDFACYEGGIGALVRGERVMTGNAAFMNLLGIRVPDDVNMKNAVFTAVNDQLVGMFAISYVPVNSVQGALISLLKWRIKLFFAVRDFNITPLMLEQKFKISIENIEYIPVHNSYSISDRDSGKEGRMSAVLTREGLGPFAEAVTSSRLLISATLVSTALSVISAAIGILIMFYICWTGAFMSARPGNLALFMLAMLAAVLIVCGYVKCKK